MMIPCHVIENHVSNFLSSQAASLQEEFEFPNLEFLCADTIREIRTGLLPGASALEYSKAVIDHNGIRAVSRSLVNLINNEVKVLQGQIISRATLNTVIQQHGQDNTWTWTQPIGYASLATDRRLPDWRRIICQHTQAILQNSKSSLHYYMLWMGNGNRQNKEYGYNLPLGMTYERSISLNYCPIKFSPGLDVGNGHVLVKIEICPSGQRHPETYATSANDEDPACRLAFRVRYRDSTGLEVQYYKKNSNMSPLFRANEFVDVLADEIPSELIAQMPRRYLAFKKGQAPPRSRNFREVGGNYTTSLSDD